MKDQLESLRGDENKSSIKARHTLRRRYVDFIGLGQAKRVRREFTGLKRKINKNHSFQSTSMEGEILVRWLPCSCRRCFLDSSPGLCEQQVFNLPAEQKPISVTNATVWTRGNWTPSSTIGTESTSVIWKA